MTLTPTQAGSSQSAPIESHHDLIDAVKRAQPGAWGRLIRHYSPLIQYWCHQCGVSRDDVADVQQDVFRSLSVAIKRFHYDQPGDTFHGWLRTITQNKSRDHLRQRERSINAVGGALHQCMLSQYPSATTNQVGEDSQSKGREASAWRECLVQIECVKMEFETRTWTAFWRTAIDGQRANDVAEELGMTHAAVRKAKSRVLCRLRATLCTTN